MAFQLDIIIDCFLDFLLGGSKEAGSFEFSSSSAPPSPVSEVCGVLSSGVFLQVPVSRKMFID